MLGNLLLTSNRHSGVYRLLLSFLPFVLRDHCCSFYGVIVVRFYAVILSAAKPPISPLHLPLSVLFTVAANDRVPHPSRTLRWVG